LKKLVHYAFQGTEKVLAWGLGLGLLHKQRKDFKERVSRQALKTKQITQIHVQKPCLVVGGGGGGGGGCKVEIGYGIVRVCTPWVKSENDVSKASNSS
jgi:hypothetical protein